MQLRLLTLVTTSFFTLASSNASNSAPKLVQQINCDRATTTLAINECASRLVRASDRQLNQVYQKLRPKLDSKQRQRLTQAQLNWIKFRDTTCTYESGELSGGTASTAAYLYCIDRVTKQRIADLQGYLDRA